MEGTLTPIPPKEDLSFRKPDAMTMSFPDAMRQVLNGKMVKRISWGTIGDYGVLKDGWLSIFTKGEMHTWTVSEGDMGGEDWIIVTELN